MAELQAPLLPDSSGSNLTEQPKKRAWMHLSKLEPVPRAAGPGRSVGKRGSPRPGGASSPRVTQFSAVPRCATLPPRSAPRDPEYALRFELMQEDERLRRALRDATSRVSCEDARWRRESSQQRERDEKARENGDLMKAELEYRESKNEQTRRQIREQELHRARTAVELEDRREAQLLREAQLQSERAALSGHTRDAIRERRLREQNLLDEQRRAIADRSEDIQTAREKKRKEKSARKKEREREELGKLLGETKLRQDAYGKKRAELEAFVI